MSAPPAFLRDVGFVVLYFGALSSWQRAFCFARGRISAWSTVERQPLFYPVPVPHPVPFRHAATCQQLSKDDTYCHKKSSATWPSFLRIFSHPVETV